MADPTTPASTRLCAGLAFEPACASSATPRNPYPPMLFSPSDHSEIVLCYPPKMKLQSGIRLLLLRAEEVA